jgi:hypothetical protein
MASREAAWVADTPGGFISGDNFDLHAGGLKIEVKSTSYWQSWKLYGYEERCWRNPEEIAGLVQRRKPTPDLIKFAGLYARQTSGAKLSELREFKAEIYIFAFQNEADPFRWNALDLDQWEFYALERAALIDEKAKRDARYKTKPPKGFALSLLRLRELRGRAKDQKGMSSVELRAWAKRRFALLESVAGVELSPKISSAIEPV